MAKYALPNSWEDIILKDKGKQKIYFDNHNVRKSKICSHNKLTSKELCLNLVDADTVKPTVQDYFDNLFELFEYIFLNPLTEYIYICRKRVNEYSNN